MNGRVSVHVRLGWTLGTVLCHDRLSVHTLLTQRWTFAIALLQHCFLDIRTESEIELNKFYDDPLCARLF